MKKRNLSFSLLPILCIFFMVSVVSAAQPSVQLLGKTLYFDKHLSLNQNQSCASCHHPSAGFADPLNRKFPYDFPVSFGSDTSLNGGRNAPTSSYAAFIPVFSWNTTAALFEGGQFLDGRAPTLKDQAKGPFLNPVEMAMADEATVIAAIADSANKNFKSYVKLFKSVYGIDIVAVATSFDTTDDAMAYDKVAEAIATFEQTAMLNSFTSKYDYYLAGQAELSVAEQNGLEIFENPALGNCAACHPSQAITLANGSIVPPMFTDFTYDNLGIPKSTNVMIAGNPVEYGLGARTNLEVFNPAIDPAIILDGNAVYLSEAGKFRVSTLRNALRTAPYSHNGFFATLADVVHFYNTRDVPEANWGPAEVPKNVNMDEVGNLGLSPQQEADLVAFIATLTDGYAKQMPANFVLPAMTPL